jgi:hypothetical protein
MNFAIYSGVFQGERVLPREAGLLFEEELFLQVQGNIRS